MAKVTLVFKGGAQTDIDVQEFTVTRSAIGGISKVAWVDGKDHVFTIEPDELAAVIERKE